MSKPAGTPLKLKTASWKMQSHRQMTPSNRVSHFAAAFVLAVVLEGCGGGGGGSPGLNPDFAYPTLPDAIIPSANSGVTSNYSKTGNQLDVEGGTVDVSFNSPAQSLTITVTGVPSGEPTFTFTVNTATLAPLTFIPLDTRLPTDPSSPCIGCLRQGTSTDGTTSFTYLDHAVAGMNYSTLGMWSRPSSLPGTDAGAAFSIGVITRAQDLPILNANATYNGFMVGRYANGTDTYVVGANATAIATFTPGPNSSVVFSTTNTFIAREGSPGPLDGLQTSLNLTGTLTYDSGTNSLKMPPGTLTAPGVGGVPLTGNATARYYGPPTGGQATPAEFGGAFFVGNGSEQMNGSFALKK